MNVMSIDRVVVEWFNGLFNNNGWGNLILIVLSLVLCIFLAGVIGYEREWNGHAAGLRTHILVAVGSAITMIVSIYGIGYENRDTMRLAAQVVSGIGFLGAGTIIQTGTDIKGLTTATTLWMVMAIGLACGAGSFIVAALGSLLTIFSLTALKPIERHISAKNPVILLVVPTNSAVLKDVSEIARSYGLSLKSFETQLVQFRTYEALRLLITFSPAKRSTLDDFVEALSQKIRPLTIRVC
ncbi:MAG: MgtC/SapB family protein [Bacilli bacterium]